MNRKSNVTKRQNRADVKPHRPSKILKVRDFHSHSAESRGLSETQFKKRRSKQKANKRAASLFFKLKLIN
jgi:hypothetical protein